MKRLLTKKTAAYFAAVLFLSIIAVIVCVGLGVAKMSFSQSLQAMFGKGSDTQVTIVQNIRLPRVLAAYFVGAALSVAGAAMQGVFENPMADPSILGVSSGSALGATLAISFGGTMLLGQASITIAAFIGGIGAALLVFIISSKGKSTFTLLLSGIALSSFFTAISSTVMMLNREKIDQIMSWNLGGFTAIGWNKVTVLIPVCIACTIALLFFSRELNVLSSGEDEAHSMGVDVRKTRRTILAISSLLTASAVATSGTVGFVGLMIPHMVRLILGPDHRILIPAAMLTGGLFLTIADTFARLVAAPIEIPVGIITALLGVPFFLWLLRKGSKI